MILAFDVIMNEWMKNEGERVNNRLHLGLGIEDPGDPRA